MADTTANPLLETNTSLGDYPMPEELEGQVSQESWNAFVEEMNDINSSYDEAYAGIDQDALQEEMQTGISGLGGSMGLSDEEYDQLLAMAEAQGVPVTDSRNSAVSQAGQLQSDYRAEVRAAMQEFGIPESVERNGRIFYLDYGIDNRMGLSIYDRDAEGIGSGKSFTYSIDHKDNDQGGFDLLTTAAMIGVSLMTGGAMSGVLEGMGLTTAQAAAASSAITNSAIQLASTGSLDLKQALISAGTSYFSSGGFGELSDKFGLSIEGGLLDETINTVKDGLATFEKAISTGSSIADAAIKAGGTDALLQLVSTGEVDLTQALTAAATAGGKEAFTTLVSQQAANMSEDEFYQWIQSDEELQSAIDTANTNGWFPDLDNSGDFSVGDLEVSVENQPLTDEQMTLPDAGVSVEQTPAMALQDGGTYYVDADGTVYDTSQVRWNQEVDGYTIAGTNTPVTQTKYDANTDRFYDPETLDVVLRGEDSALLGATGEEFTYGQESGGNTIFESVSPAPTDMGTAQYSGTLKSVDGDLDVYYDPTTNTEFVYNPDDPTEVQYLTEEQQQEVTRENTTEDSAGPTPTVNPDDKQAGSSADAGSSGTPNNAPADVTSESSASVEGGQNTSDAVVIVSPPSTAVDDVNATVGDVATPPTGGTTGDVNTSTGTKETAVGGLLTGIQAGVSKGTTDATGGQDSTQDGNSGTTDGTNTGNDNGNANNIGTIGDMITGLGGNVTGSGADDEGGGDEDVGDGTGGTGGDGGDGGGSGGMLSGGDGFDPLWTDLFPYTKITPAQAKALQPYKDYIAQGRGMFNL